MKLIFSIRNWHIENALIFVKYADHFLDYKLRYFSVFVHNTNTVCVVKDSKFMIRTFKKVSNAKLYWQSKQGTFLSNDAAIS